MRRKRCAHPPVRGAEREVEKCATSERGYPSLRDVRRTPIERRALAALAGLVGLGALTLGGCMPAVRPHELPGTPPATSAQPPPADDGSTAHGGEAQ